MAEGSGTEELQTDDAERSHVATTARVHVHLPHPRETPTSPEHPARRRSRWPILAGVAGIAAIAFVWKGLPAIDAALSHISTDDAFVTGDSTTVTAKLGAEVKEVLINENDFVEKGALLVRLDRDLARVLTEQKRAELGRAKYTIDQLVGTLESASADLAQARNGVRGSLATLHEAYRAVEAQQVQVHYKIASLKAEAASLRSAQADFALARKAYDRVHQLVNQQSAAMQELDERYATLQSAQEKARASEQKVQQARALLALSPDPEHPESLPNNLERTDSDVRRALATGQQALATLGISFSVLDMEPDTLRAILRDFNARPNEVWIESVPSVQAARARYHQAYAALGGSAFDPKHPHEHPAIKFAERELEELELKLDYSEIHAPVSGYVHKKSVNRGDFVQIGQGLLTIQPLESVYVVANFKETQLADLTIGQPVDIEVDAYPDRTFRGRVSGIAPATGAASTLLPTENATGNFVKVVQRVPVRIELTEPNPREAPLFVGLSVLPKVDIKARPAGNDAGERLRRGSPRTLALKEARP
jgi:membrane fusion protein (multidrug efflux system)